MAASGCRSRKAVLPAFVAAASEARGGLPPEPKRARYSKTHARATSYANPPAGQEEEVENRGLLEEGAPDGDEDGGAPIPTVAFRRNARTLRPNREPVERSLGSVECLPKPVRGDGTESERPKKAHLSILSPKSSHENRR